MAQLVYALNQSLDGVVDHTAFAPGPLMFRHFIEEVRTLSGSLYGRTMYEVMRYWDETQADWDQDEREYATAWRKQSKWVVSQSLEAVGPNATLVKGDLGAAVRRLKAERPGEIEVAGPTLAGSLSRLGLIDEYRIYLHPVVAGEGKRYFDNTRPTLRLTSHEEIAEGVVRLTYAPA
ncbi:MULTISPECIES: dihydrofolate reductase family protein [Hyphobacterium]|uniref:Dihydrofolate reductase family protein n=1 Tax=Hyphobacterium vulgare TaxID=1736751 RepID=A0ABV6ZTA2_9PROT